MEFRKMQPGDRAAMQSFFDDMGGASAGFFNRGHGNERNTMAAFDHMREDMEYYVMVEGDQIIGLFFLWALDTCIPWMGIAVRDEWQGRHVGTTMIQTALADLKQRGYGGLLLTTATCNFKGQALYEKCGFVRQGVCNWGEYLYLHTFRK